MFWKLSLCMYVCLYIRLSVCLKDGGAAVEEGRYPVGVHGPKQRRTSPGRGVCSDVSGDDGGQRSRRQTYLQGQFKVKSLLM